MTQVNNTVACCVNCHFMCPHMLPVPPSLH